MAVWQSEDAFASSVCEALTRFAASAKDHEALRVLADATPFLRWNVNDEATLCLLVGEALFRDILDTRSQLEGRLTRLALVEIRDPQYNVTSVMAYLRLQGIEADGIRRRNVRLNNSDEFSDDAAAEACASALWRLTPDGELRTLLEQSTPVVEWQSNDDSVSLALLVPHAVLGSLSDRRAIAQRLSEDVRNIRSSRYVFRQVLLYTALESGSEAWRGGHDADFAQTSTDTELAERFAYTSCILAYAEGDDSLAEMIANSEPMLERNWNDDSGILVLALPHDLFDQVARHRADFKSRLERLVAQIRGRAIAVSETRIVQKLESPDYNWREVAARNAEVLKSTNQGRVRSDNIAPIVREGFLFRSYTEYRVFRELKSRNVPVAPLPAFFIPQERRREPDFLLLLSDRTVIIEVHGDISDTSDERVRPFTSRGVDVLHLDVRECDDISVLRRKLNGFLGQSG